MFGWTHRHTPSSHSVHSPRVSGARLGAGDAEMRVAPALSEAHRPVSVVQRAGRGLLRSALQTRAGYPSPTPSGGSARHGDVAGAPMRRAPGGRGAWRPLGGGLVCAVTGRPITAALNVGSFGRDSLPFVWKHGGWSWVPPLPSQPPSHFQELSGHRGEFRVSCFSHISVSYQEVLERSAFLLSLALRNPTRELEFFRLLSFVA